MESDTKLIRVYIPQTKKVVIVRRNDFKVQKGEKLPSAATLLDGIAQRVELEEQTENNEDAEQHLSQAFIEMSAEGPKASFA